MTQSTISSKSNATLASELKKLGFSRGVSSWDKSNFRKVVETDSWLDTPAIIEVEVSIRNIAFAGSNWVVNKVHLATKNETIDSGALNGQVTLTLDAQNELFELLNAVRELR